jgi:hypothetical protein
MNGDHTERLSILLSQEELLAVLDVLRVRFIPGLDAEALEGPTEEQQQLMLAVARRALQARELAQVREDGGFLLHRALLTTVGVCAYSESAALVYHWPAGGHQATRFFGHIRGDEVVAHTRPDLALHHFALLASKEQLITRLLNVCEYQESPASERLELTVTREAFIRARELAGARNEAEATHILAEGGAVEAAHALAHALAESPPVSVLQLLKQNGNESVQSRQFTLLQNGRHAWFVLPLSGEADAPLLVRTTTTEEVHSALLEWL